jgi:hypothetical protein
MARKLTMRQQWILSFLRDNQGATLKEISEASPPNIEATEAFEERHPTYEGEPYTVRSVEYPTAQQSVARLIDLGLVRREPEDRRPADGPYMHFLVQMPESDDPLEKLFAEDVMA